MKLSENLKTNLFAFLGAFVCVAIFISFDKCSQEDSSMIQIPIMKIMRVLIMNLIVKVIPCLF